MKTQILSAWTFFIGASLLSLSAVVLNAQGTAFTYQGRLDVSGSPANGSYDFRFRLASDSLGNTFVAGPLLSNAVPVSGGLFAVNLDFGAAFNGSNFWLQVDVKTNGAGAYTTLTPLQALLPTPYAMFAAAASNLNGTLPTSQLAGTVGTSLLANDSVTSAKILDGAITNADLANNAVTSAKILDGSVSNVDLAADAVTSAKILDGTIVGADMANNAVGSAQLADTIDLGTTNVSGQLNVYRTSVNTPSITLFGSQSQISTYGSDGLEQIRLWGNSWGEIYLYDSSASNNLAAVLTANNAGGGRLYMNRGQTNDIGIDLRAGTTTGGRELLYSGAGDVAVDMRAQFSAGSPGAWMALYHTNQERITFAAQNGDTGRGGLIDVKNDSSQNTLRLIGDSGAGRGNLEMYQGATLVGILESHSGGAWLKTFDELGAEAAIIGSSGGTGGFCELHNAAGAVGLRLDGDDAGGGLVQLRNAVGAVTVTLDGDVSGRGRVTTAELQITSSTVSLTNNATLDPSNRYARISGSGGAVTLNATTAIANGSGVGSILILEGTSDVNTVTIPDAANTVIGVNRTLGLNDTLTLIWNGADWVQLAFSNN